MFVRVLLRIAVPPRSWSILCEPMAQEAMALSLDRQDAEAQCADEDRTTFHYRFHEHVRIRPRTICNFLREIERRYQHENPYHNNIHAADVTQTCNYIFQSMGDGNLTEFYRLHDPIKVFSLLLAATFHDVAHPGTTNLFQQNALTPLAIQYNDMSVLENMHSAVGHSLLMGEEKREEWDVFDGWGLGEKLRARRTMTTSIVKGTDPANHFKMVQELDGLIGELQALATAIAEENNSEPPPILSILIQINDLSGEPEDSPRRQLEQKRKQTIDIIPGFVLHVADISNSAKARGLTLYWAERVLAEFFAQGESFNMCRVTASVSWCFKDLTDICMESSWCSRGPRKKNGSSHFALVRPRQDQHTGQPGELHSIFGSSGL